jgi:PAS domain S-box-containing protein
MNRRFFFYRISIVFIGLVIQCQNIFALEPTKPLSDFIIDVWNQDKGLSAKVISAILQTRDGYIWLATDEGLIRFDGVQFTTFDNSYTKEIPDNYITSLAEDKEGNLWFGTLRKGVCKFSPPNKFTHFSADDGLPNDGVLSLLVDSKNNLWLGTSDGVCEVLQCSFQKKNNIVTFFQGKFPAISAACRAIVEDSKGNIYANSFGLQRKKANSDSFATLYPHVINYIAEDKQGVIWFTSEAELFYFHNEIITPFDLPNRKTKERIMQLNCDSKGAMWVATNGNGIFRIVKGEIQSLTAAEGLSHNTTLCIYEDKSGIMWIGTSGGGLLRLKNKNFDVLNTNIGLSDTAIYSIFEDSKGRMWIGTKFGGVNCVEVSNYELQVASSEQRKIQNSKPETPHSQLATSYRITSVFDTTNGLHSNFIRAFAEGDDGSIFIGTKNGFHRLQNNRVTYYPNRGGTNDIRMLYKDRNKNIWFGSLGHSKIGDGISKFENDSLFNSALGDSSGIGANLRAVCEDNDGNMWLGTQYAVHRIGKNGIITFTEKDGLKGTTCLYLFCDREGTIWISEYGNGLQRYNPTGKGSAQFSQITKRNGLSEDVIYSILEDDNGNLWFAGDKGIFRAKKKDLNDFLDNQRIEIQCVAYGRDDGLLSGCNGGSYPSSWKTRDGKFWIPTSHGVVIIDPNHIEQNLIPPPVYIEKISADGDIIFPKRNEQIQLSADIKNLEFDFTALSFLSPQNILFKYKLEGFDNEWSQPVLQRKTNYTHLPDGDYTFRVIACNNDGVWNEQGATVAILIPPRFWNTWWFRILSVVCVSSIVAFVMIRQRKYNRTLQASEERYRILTELMSDYAYYDEIDENGKLTVVWMTGAFERLTGYSLAEANAPDFLMRYIFPEDMPDAMKNFQRMLSGKPSSHEGRAFTKDGKIIWLHHYAVPVVDKRTGRVTGLYGIASDITERKKHESEKQSFATQMAKIEMKALRAQMNPHFIFNCLNAIQDCIVSGENETAYKYLSKFARLLRFILENSDKQRISLEEEITALELYLALESLRFDKKFEYVIDVSSAIEQEEIKVPPMLIQPYVENAIWHGLLHKDGDRKLNLTITQTENILHCVVEDNGIGRKRAQELRSDKNSPYESKGMKVTQDRINLLNTSSDDKSASVNVIDVYDTHNNSLGTRVEISIPIRN